MVNAMSPLCHINLLFALLTRWRGARRHGKPSARFVAVVERTEQALAQTIRATLAQDGVADPDLDDPAFLVWFKSHYPGPAHVARAAGGAGAPANAPFAIQNVAAAGIGWAGSKPDPVQARAPPKAGPLSSQNQPLRPSPGRPLALAFQKRPHSDGKPHTLFLNAA